jgi:hypothetical protein
MNTRFRLMDFILGENRLMRARSGICRETLSHFVWPPFVRACSRSSREHIHSSDCWKFPNSCNRPNAPPPEMTLPTASLSFSNIFYHLDNTVVDGAQSVNLLLVNNTLTCHDPLPDQCNELLNCLTKKCVMGRDVRC